MYSPYAVGEASDGTFTQDLRVCRPPLSPPVTPSIAVQQLICAEMEARTRLTCDALTDFQRIVGLCVSERFGRWTFTLTSSAHTGGGWSCPRCGCTQQDAACGGNQPGASDTQKASVDKVRAFFSSEGCRTPFCSAEELRATSNRCMYAADASALLERRYAFQQEFGSLLQRINAASQGIQESVTR